MASSSRIGVFGAHRAFADAPSAAVKGERDVIAAGDFRIDLGTGQASVRDRELRLTEEELELLVFLIGHRKSIITPQTRLTTRWGSSRVCHSDFMRVLAQLRKKLESVEGGARYIRTEPWVVYLFDPHGRDEVH